MKMDLRNPKNGEILMVDLPVNYAKMQSICDILNLDNTPNTEVHISKMYTHHLKKPLEGKTVNLDELNFFTKKFKGIYHGQQKDFMVVANGLENPTTKDLINLTQNIKCYSVLRDYPNLSKFNAEDLDKLGQNFYTQETGSRPDYYFSGEVWIDELKEMNPNPISNEYRKLLSPMA